MIYSVPYVLPPAAASRLLTCDPQIIRVVNRVLQVKAVTVPPSGGFRGQEEQQKAFQAGNSRLQWPDSMHNKTPLSLAVDLVPLPVDWKNLDAFIKMADVVLELAEEEGVALIWGGHWKKIKDFPHFELA